MKHRGYTEMALGIRVDDLFTEQELADAKAFLPAVLFSAADVIRQIAYRRAVRAGFYNDEIPASVVVTGLQAMLAGRRAS